MRCALRTYPFDYPFPPNEDVDFFRVNYGPMVPAFASLDANAEATLRSELVRLCSRHTRAGNDIQVCAEYLDVIATRG